MQMCAWRLLCAAASVAAPLCCRSRLEGGPFGLRLRTVSRSGPAARASYRWAKTLDAAVPARWAKVCVRARALVDAALFTAPSDAFRTRETPRQQRAVAARRTRSPSPHCTRCSLQSVSARRIGENKRDGQARAALEEGRPPQTQRRPQEAPRGARIAEDEQKDGQEPTERC